MGCLYCGKEIGAFRLLRDSEFCGAAHRKNYGERLGKALHQIAAPAPPPAPVANFIPRMPLQEGRTNRALTLWQTGQCGPVKISQSWPVAIDCCLGQSHRSLMQVQPAAIDGRYWNEANWRVPPTPIRLPRLNSALEPIPFIDRDSDIPPIAAPRATAPAEPVESFVFLASASTQAAAPRFPAVIQMPVRPKAPATACACHAPLAEPVANVVCPATALTPAAFVPVRRYTARLAMPVSLRTLPTAGPAKAATAEPLEILVRPATALTPAAFVPFRRYTATLAMPVSLRTLPTAGPAKAAAAEPLEILVRPATALTPAAFLPVRRYTATLAMPVSLRTLPTAGPAKAAAAEPLEILVRPATALTPMAVVPGLSHAPQFAMPACQSALPTGGAAPSLVAQPVAILMRPATALTPEAAVASLRFAGKFEIPTQHRALCSAGPCAAPAAEPVARFLRLATALTPAAFAAAPRLPQPSVAAEMEPLPVADELLETPAICLGAIAAPAAEPVCRFVHSVTQSFLTPALLQTPPPFASEIDVPHVPYITASKPPAAAEPVMTWVGPHAADVPLAQARAASPATAALLFTELPGMVQEVWALANPAPTLAVEPAESLLVAATAANLALTAKAVCRVPQTAGFVLAVPAPAISSPVAGLEPAPVESLTEASAAGAQASKATMRILNFTISSSQELLVPGFDALRLAPQACQPQPGSPNVVAPRPIQTISVAAPEQEQGLWDTALPQPGLRPVEFHAQRWHGVVFERPEWKRPSPAALPPRFTLRPVFEKLGQAPHQQKAVRPEPDFMKTFQMPAAKKPSARLRVAGRIAASVLLATSLWYGYSSLRGNRHTGGGVQIAAVQTALPSVREAGGSAAATAEGTQAVPAATGRIARVRQSIAQRASRQANENFRGSMQNWGSGSRYPTGWSRHPDGYINTGALALFRPSLNFTDYRLEFFGQIENKGMSWSVRAKDSNNYHAMKVAVVEAGLRPLVALVHWDVIDGKAGRQSRIPLNIMVHNQRPMQVAVNVEGNHLVTSIDGEEVDSFITNTLASGGVGFFSEPNERARLYWMKISKNDDWLGHVCAFLAGDDAVRATAELRGPEFPGSAPSPWTPGEESTHLAAAWAGLPYLRAAQRARASKTRRIDRWNT